GIVDWAGLRSGRPRSMSRTCKPTLPSSPRRTHSLTATPRSTPTTARQDLGTHRSSVSNVAQRPNAAVNRRRLIAKPCLDHSECSSLEVDRAIDHRFLHALIVRSGGEL